MAQNADLEQRIVQAMQGLNFTASDARAYVALLQGHPATGYELAARSGVPRSAIYNVLKRMQSLGLINEIQKKPAKFSPLPPQRLFDLLESKFQRNLGELRGALEDLATGSDDALTWTVQGYRGLLEQAETLIRTAERSVHVSLWRREALALERVLNQARERGIDVVLFSFAELPGDCPQSFGYGIDEEALESHWDRRITLICDGRVLLVGGAEQRESNRAVVTDEPSLVEMAVNNLVLDLTLYGERMKRSVGEVVGHLVKHVAPVDELLAKVMLS